MDYWPLISKTALDKGANPMTVKKWRQRGVPYRWQIVINDARGPDEQIPRIAFVCPVSWELKETSDV
jgi:hypothetical protein